MAEQNQQNKNEEKDLNQLLKVRREKLKDLQDNGKDPFQITKFDVTAHSSEIKDNFEQMDLFTDAARIDKQEKLDRAADALRRRFGGAAVTRATLLTPDTRKPEALSAAKERDKDKK